MRMIQDILQCRHAPYSTRYHMRYCQRSLRKGQRIGEGVVHTIVRFFNSVTRGRILQGPAHPGLKKLKIFPVALLRSSACIPMPVLYTPTPFQSRPQPFVTAVSYVPPRGYLTLTWFPKRTLPLLASTSQRSQSSLAPLPPRARPEPAPRPPLAHPVPSATATPLLLPSLPLTFPIMPNMNDCIGKFIITSRNWPSSVIIVSSTYHSVVLPSILMLETSVVAARLVLLPYKYLYSPAVYKSHTGSLLSFHQNSDVRSRPLP